MSDLTPNEQEKRIMAVRVATRDHVCACCQKTMRREFDSEELFQDGREVTITHKSEVYRLKITKSEKLILNK